MNPVFWLLVVIAAILLWFCLSFMFKAVGGIFLKLFNDAKNAIKEEKEKKDEG